WQNLPYPERLLSFLKITLLLLVSVLRFNTTSSSRLVIFKNELATRFEKINKAGSGAGELR
ncbi:MAG: hypothetical protein ABIJ84_01980, partial [bacterium]